MHVSLGLQMNEPLEKMFDDPTQFLNTEKLDSLPLWTQAKVTKIANANKSFTIIAKRPYTASDFSDKKEFA